MRVPRFRIRTMMVAVAVLGTALGVLAERRARFLRRAAYHRTQFNPVSFTVAAFPGTGGPIPAASESGLTELVAWDSQGNELTADQERAHSALNAWNSTLVNKYEHAARYPWLPVEPDPPPPN